MSFGGGGGIVGVSNHVHSNAVGEGGELSKTLTLMGGDVLFSLITDNTAQVNINTANIAANVAAIAANTVLINANTANLGKWSTTNVSTFKNSVIAGVQVGSIEEVT